VILPPSVFPGFAYSIFLAYLQNVEFDFGASGGVFPHEGVSLDEVHVVLVSQADVQDALVISGNNARNVMRLPKATSFWILCPSRK
jgi:hypothetical protein